MKPRQAQELPLESDCEEICMLGQNNLNAAVSANKLPVASILSPGLEALLPQFSAYTQAYISSFKNKPKIPDELEKLNLSKEERKNFKKSRDAVTENIVNIPVCIHERVYDVETICSLIRPDGSYQEPFTRMNFSLEHVVPLRKLRDKCEVRLAELTLARKVDAARKFLKIVEEDDYENAVKYIKANACHPEIFNLVRNDNGNGPLMHAILNGHTSIATALLAVPRIDLGAAHESLMTQAAQRGDRKIVYLLHAHRYDRDLIAAIRNHSYDLSIEFCQEIISLIKPNSNMETSVKQVAGDAFLKLSYAYKAKNNHLERYTSLKTAQQFKNDSVVEHELDDLLGLLAENLLKCAPNITMPAWFNILEKENRLPVSLFALAVRQKTDAAIIKFLLLNLDIDQIQRCDELGFSAAYYAVKNNNCEVFELIYKKSKDIDWENLVKAAIEYKAIDVLRDILLVYKEEEGVSQREAISDEILSEINIEIWQEIFINVCENNLNHHVEFLINKIIINNHSSKVTLNHALLIVYRSNNIKLFEAILAAGADPDIIYNEELGDSILLDACKNKRNDFIKCLLVAKANPDRTNKNKESCLSWSYCNNEIHTFNLLLEYGAKCSYYSKFHFYDITRQLRTTSTNLLIQACLDKSMEFIKSLLRYNTNFDINAVDDSGCCALLLAYKNQNLELFSLLLTAGANPDILFISSNARDTLLLDACKNKRSDFIKCLLANKANPDKVNANNESCLSWAYYNIDHETFCLLLKYGANQSRFSKLHVTLFSREVTLTQANLFIQACLDNRTECITSLISLGYLAAGDLTMVDESGRTPLLIAYENNYSKLFSILLAAGADQNVIINKKSGNRLLHQACQDHKIDFVILLCGHASTDISCKNKRLKTPYEIAQKNIYPSASEKTIRQLLNAKIVELHGNEYTEMFVMAFYYSYRNNEIRLFESMLSKGVNPSFIYDDGNNYLHQASEDERADYVQELLYHGSWYTDVLNKAEESALCIAYRKNNIDIFTKLLKQGGADPNVVINKQSGNSVMHQACEEGREAFVKVLLDDYLLCKPQLNKTNNFGHTPGEIADFKARPIAGYLFGEYAASAEHINIKRLMDDKKLSSQKNIVVTINTT